MAKDLTTLNSEDSAQPKVDSACKERREYFQVGFALSLLFAVLVWPVIFTFNSSKYHPSSEYRDQVVAHEGTIKKMSQNWPHLDPVHYGNPGITCGPAYYYFMAGISRTTNNIRLWQFVSSLFGLLALWQVYHYATCFVRPRIAAVLAFPFLACPYFLGSSIWIMTDNAALACALPVVAGAAIYHPTFGRQLRWGVYSAAAVANRQVYIWLAFPIFASAFLQTWRSRPTDNTSAYTASSSHSPSPWSISALVGGVIGASVPVVVLGFFVWQWHGLLPPMDGFTVQKVERTLMNPALFTVVLGQIGLFGVFFLPLIPWRGALPKIFRAPSTWVALGAGLLVSVAWPTEFLNPTRSGGSLWTASKLFPTIWERSLMWPPLTLLGAFVLVTFWHTAKDNFSRRRLLFWYACVAAFVVANSANPFPSQRYTEPFLLALLCWWTAMILPAKRTTWSQLTGPLTLAALMLLLALYRVYFRAYWPDPSLT